MFSFLAFGGTLAGGNPTLYGYVKNPNAWVDVFGLDCSQEILRNIGYLQGRKKEEIQKQYYLNSENKYEKSVLQNEKTEQEEELREAYIQFVSKQKNGFFDEDLYNIFFEKLNERFKQWKKNGAVPMRAFEICIDCIYVLSKTAQKPSEKDLEKSKTVKDEMYGLLMGFE